MASVGVWLLHVRGDDFSAFTSAHCARSFEVVF